MKINLIKGAKALLLATALLVNTVVSTSYIKAEEAGSPDTGAVAGDTAEPGTENGEGKVDEGAPADESTPAAEGEEDPKTEGEGTPEEGENAPKEDGEETPVNEGEETPKENEETPGENAENPAEGEEKPEEGKPYEKKVKLGEESPATIVITLDDRDGSNPLKELHLEVIAYARVDWQGEPLDGIFGYAYYYENDIIVDTSDLTKNTFNVDVNVPKKVYVDGTDKEYPLTYKINVSNLPDSYHTNIKDTSVENNNILPVTIFDADSAKGQTYAYAYVRFNEKDGFPYYFSERDDTRFILSYKSKVTVGNQELRIGLDGTTGTWIRMTKEELENNEPMTFKVVSINNPASKELARNFRVEVTVKPEEETVFNGSYRRYSVHFNLQDPISDDEYVPNTIYPVPTTPEETTDATSQDPSTSESTSEKKTEKKVVKKTQNNLPATGESANYLVLASLLLAGSALVIIRKKQEDKK